jgi:ribose 5-phosphate isomerase A
LTDREAQKRLAAERAVGFVQPGMRLGLGTGSTARYVTALIGERLRTGELRDILAVPTSRATARYASELGIPLGTIDDAPSLDLAIDGADEFDPRLDLIKGMGGALLWEKIVERAAERLVIVADESKRVTRLGTRSALPVEVVPFGWRTVEPFLQSLGAATELRRTADGSPFLTDGGHYIIHCRFPDGIADAPATELALARRPGIVESGLFIGMATTVVVAGDLVEVLERP